MSKQEANSVKKVPPLKKYVFILLLIIFVPAALYLLAVGKYMYFFLFALATWILIKIIEKIS